MNEPQIQIKRGVIYYPPKPEVLEKYAEAVCETLEQKYGKGFLDNEVVQGFGDFFKVVTKIYANYLSRKSQEQNQ